MNLQFNFKKIIGKIKPMHGVGQPPVMLSDADGLDSSFFHWLQEANIPYSRLHDVGGHFGCNLFVDIPNIFRDFNADENNSDSYDFAFTDLLLKNIVKYKCEPYFRLGVTIENAHMIKAYRIFPPNDYEKWARICEHIIRHYNEGWANGYHFNIKYWEIWNEPDNEESIQRNNMWKGTAEQYYSLYSIVSRHLRACFGDSIKIGGYSSTGMYLGYMQKDEKYNVPHEVTHWEERAIYHTKFFDGFLKRIKEENLPFDFFSHHSYMTVERTLDIEQYVEQKLADAGFDNVEIHINEWNTNRTLETRGTSQAAADVAAMMIAMQNTKIQVMCFYDARFGTSVYGGFFNPLTKEPFCTYYSFKAFGKLYALGDEVEVTGAGDGLYALAATDGKGQGILIANIGGEKTVETNLTEGYTAYRIDFDHHLTPVDLNYGKFEMAQFETLFLQKNG